MARVVVTHRLPEGALDPLARHEIVQFDGDGWQSAVADAEALVCVLTAIVDEAVLTRGSRLQVVANAAVGYDNVDVVAATSLRIPVCNTPDVLDETTADLAFGLILAASRLMSSAEAELRGGRWSGWDFGQYLGRDVYGATLGLVGYGRIGRAVGRRAAGFGMRVIHHSRRDNAESGYVADLEELLRFADVVSLHVPLTEATRHLIDARRLSLMKPTAVLVNTARGPVVDEEALVDALEEGRLFAAGLDVYDNEPVVSPRLLSAPRTVLLPHIGSASVATRTAMARLAAESARAVLEGERPSNVVNPDALSKTR